MRRPHWRTPALDQTLARDPSDVTAFDVVVNSDRLGVEGAAQFVGWAVRTKQMLTELTEPNEHHAHDTLEDLTGA